MIQPYYDVEGVASFWTTTESERWVLSRAIIWLLVLWYEHWPRFHIFNFPIPIPHSPFFVLAVSISHTAPLGVALQLLIQYPFLLFYCEVIFTIKKYAKIIEKKFCKKNKLSLLCWNSTCSGRSFLERFSFSNDVRPFKGSSCLTELFLGFNFSISMHLK